MRPNRTVQNRAGSKFWDLKVEELQQQGQGKQFAKDNPMETGPTMTESGEDLYTSKMQRTDQDLARAKQQGRTRMPGKKGGLSFNKGGMVKGHCREYGK
jgi:hypothetical protein